MGWCSEGAGRWLPHVHLLMALPMGLPVATTSGHHPLSTAILHLLGVFGRAGRPRIHYSLSKYDEGSMLKVGRGVEGGFAIQPLWCAHLWAAGHPP